MTQAHILRSACATALLVLAGCHGLLDVSDPTLIRDEDIANAAGANALRLNALDALVGSIQVPITDVAKFTDEWTLDVTPATSVGTFRDAQLDLRNSQAIEATTPGSDPHLGPLSYILWQTSIAISSVRAYTPDSLKGDFLAQLYAVRGYVILQMAEDLCSGFPINDVADNHTVYGGPLTTDSAIALASAQLDSSLKYVQDSVRFVEFARVVKGRALLDQGKYSEATAMVASVPTEMLYTRGVPGGIAMQSRYCLGCVLTALGNNEGTNGLPFASAHDLRVPVRVLGRRNTDAGDTLFITTKGRSASDSIVLASGIEARLIQAEAALHDAQSWKPILDSLRSTVGLDTLVDPGTTDSRVDLIYRERAFWLFMTGRRLGDLRRLIRNYDRTPESVFPTGIWRGGTGDRYGTATAIPFVLSFQQKYNSAEFTGCTSR